MSVRCLKIYLFLWCISICPIYSAAKESRYVALQIGRGMQTNKVDVIWRFYEAGPVTFRKERLKSSSVYDITLGQKVAENTYVEGEVSYSPKHKFTKKVSGSAGHTPLFDRLSAKIQSTSVFFNVNRHITSAQYNVSKCVKITPFVLVGAGIAFNRVGVTHDVDQHDDTVELKGASTEQFAWQVGGGILVSIKERLNMVISYRYRDLGALKASHCPSLDHREHLKGKLRLSTVLIGVVYKF
ncbi:porin family protein [Rickettsiales endosymbiont of Peranema trichophorum]|uniref:outer membrane protein n=1 Tax=Rickettsiales endosymbiont of Peranema trichophorum TaxID=2486577 RepID=UPI001022E4EA|nr:outer membrane beta-barrel protein [Rickettsiales endosymbiont of Peranema trichophorum]RZI46335.1 porin family protein [Rickettsiales endosymbiont of Peranema trichophorum]